MKKNIIISIIVTAVVFGGIGFYSGKAYGGSSQTSASQGAGRAGGFTRGAGRGAGGGAVVGSILSEDSTSITVGIMGGGSRIVLLSGSTSIMKSVQASTSDLTTGENVIVTGTSNSDGSVTANSIQIRPAMGQGGASTTPQQ